MPDEPILPVQQPPSVTPPPPSTAAPKLESISQDDIAREIRGDTPPPKAKFKDESGTLRVGDGEGGVADKIMPDFGEQARKMMAKKQAKPEGETEEKKVEPKKEEAKKEEAKKADEPQKADEAKPAVVAEDPPEDERRVLPHDKPATAKRINYFIRENAKLAKELDEAKKTATAAPTAANVEEVAKLRTEYQQAQDELLKFRRRYEIDNDDTFKKQYDEPVSQAETAIEATFKGRNISDATLAVIKDHGGFAAFSRSNAVFTVPTKNADGETVDVQITAAEYARRMLNQLPIADAEAIRQFVGKQGLLAAEKKVAIERAVGESKQFFEARQDEQQKQIQAAQADAEAKTKEYQVWLKSTQESTDWLKDRPVPSNASEEQKKSITEYNEFNKQLRTQLEKHPKTTAEYSEMKLDAAHAHHLRREMGERENRIKALEAEVEKLKGGMRTTSKGGSLLSDKGKPTPKDDGIAADDFKSGFRRAAQSRLAGEDE